MNLTCPQCNTAQNFDEDEIFPSCQCGHTFETLPILDRAIHDGPRMETSKTKKTSHNKLDDIIVSTESSLRVSKYLGVIFTEVVISEDIVVDELARNVSDDKMTRYQEAMSKLTIKIKNRALQLGANAVIGVQYQHCILPAGLGGPGLMIFAQGSAVSV